MARRSSAGVDITNRAACPRGQTMHMPSSGPPKQPENLFETRLRSPPTMENIFQGGPPRASDDDSSTPAMERKARLSSSISINVALLALCSYCQLPPLVVLTHSGAHSSALKCERHQSLARRLSLTHTSSSSIFIMPADMISMYCMQ